MEKNQSLLLVEDSRRQYTAIKLELENSHWQIIHCIGMSAALHTYEQGEKSGQHIGVAAVDLGLPPERDNPLGVGLQLVKTLRQRDSDLPILAYTSISPNAVSFDRIVAELLPLHISFIYLRSSAEPGMAQMLDLVWQDYVILSPGPADCLSHAVADKPDPLNDQLWETLALMAQGSSYAEIARDLPGVGIEGVRARVNRIREILIDKGELAKYQRDRQDLANWFRDHHVRYRRGKRLTRQ